MQTDFKYQLQNRQRLLVSKKFRFLFQISLVICVMIAIAFLFKLFGENSPSTPEQAESQPTPLSSPEDRLSIPLKLPPRGNVPVQILPTEPSPSLLQTQEASLTSRKQVFTVQSGQNLSIIFSKLGLKAKLLQETLGVSGVRSSLAKLKPGQELEFFWNENGNLQAMHIPIDESTRLRVNYENNHPQIEKQPISLTKNIQYRAGTIDSSLYWAGHKAKLSDKLILQLAEIFAWDIDFILDIRPGDSFQVMYETIHAQNKKIRDGDILFAKFINQDKTYQAVRYTHKNGESQYYTPSGMSLKKAFLRAPVAFSYISSHFNSSRKHPILHKIRAHKGVDYAAPIGTPIRASGNGKVVFMGRKGGYGNTVVLEHGSKYTTIYAHMLKFSKGLRMGKRINQNEIIGYIGQSGLATGPHLHYEFQTNGVHQNPVTVKLPRAEPIQLAEKQRFLEYSRTMLAKLETYEQQYALINTPGLESKAALKN